MRLQESPKPLRIGMNVRGYGRIIAVGYVGERYYWLKNASGVVSMMPADVIEATSLEGSK